MRTKIGCEYCLICKHKMSHAWFRQSKGVCKLCRETLVPVYIPKEQHQRYISAIIKKLTQKQV